MNRYLAAIIAGSIAIGAIVGGLAVFAVIQLAMPESVDAAAEVEQLRSRVFELEIEADKLRLELDSRPDIGDLIVVGKNIRQIGTGTITQQYCVQYRAFGSTAETCLPIITGSDAGRTLFIDCFGGATVGELLPASCK